MGKNMQSFKLKAEINQKDFVFTYIIYVYQDFPQRQTY